MKSPSPYIFQLQEVIPKAPFAFAKPISLKMRHQEHWIVYGKNGCGKSILVNTIMSAYRLQQGEITYNFQSPISNKVSDNILHLNFLDQYGGLTEGGAYQLRWNQGVLDDNLPLVMDYLNFTKNNPLQKILEKTLSIKDLMKKRILSLSSGEFRRFQIAQIVKKNPRLLIIENPFIGLDEHNRKQLAKFLERMILQLPIQIILICCRLPQELNGFTHIVHVNQRRIRKVSINQTNIAKLQAIHPLPKKDCLRIQHTFSVLEKSNAPFESKTILELNDISIQYNDTKILQNLNWTVRQGEHWALQGENGAGKSTLLSIICADNPQSYRCNVTLFGHRRGTGESIWDIKKHIGYVSPEMFRSYRKALPVENIVASGLFDTIGLYLTPKEDDLQKVQFWMRVFGKSYLYGRNYLELSTGEQRMVLLIRAFVKNPDLLILDEPFHGMDAQNRQLAQTIIEFYCHQQGKTLIMVSHYDEDFPSCISHKLILKKNH